MDDFEEGQLLIKVRDKQYKIWLPEYATYGVYTIIGEFVRINLANGLSLACGTSEFRALRDNLGE